MFDPQTSFAMLDPLNAIGLASAVIQFTDFGIKVVKGSLEIYKSYESDLETKIRQISLLADRLLPAIEDDTDEQQRHQNLRELGKLAKTCKWIATELLSVLGSLKANKPAGFGRKFESFQKAVAAQTPWNKKRVASLEQKLYEAHRSMLHWIQITMRYLHQGHRSDTTDLLLQVNSNRRS